MPTNTERLDLFKYDVVADANNTFNITKALNENWDKIDANVAKEQDIDGMWINKYGNIADNVSLSGTTDLSYSLTSYLPNDSNLYEIIIEGLTDTKTTSGDYAPLYLSTDFLPNTISICKARTRTASTMNSSGSSTIIVGKDRKLIISRNSNWHGVFSIYLHGYRKVR